MKSEIIFEQDDYYWVAIGRDKHKNEGLVDTNEYLIVAGNEGFLLDPGGLEIFPEVLNEVAKYIHPKDIRGLFASHQDPDIASSLPLWVELNPDITVYTPWLWAGFLSHFAMGVELSFVGIPDNGMEQQIGSSGKSIYFVPAHYCHSSGNFSLYDPTADIFFSGDMGGALVPDMDYNLFVENFSSHIQYMEGFHKRWMPSKSALLDWVNRVRAINPSMMAPQHGSIFKGEDIERYLRWLEGLEVSVWNNESEKTNIMGEPWMKWKR